MCLSSVSQSEAEIRHGGYRDMGAVKKGVVPRNVTVVKKCTQVIFVIYGLKNRKTLRNAVCTQV